MITLGGFLIEPVEVCIPCLGPLDALGGEAVTPASAPRLASAAFSSREAFHVAISSSSMGEIPLVRNGTRLLRNLKQINKAPTRSKTPTTESTVLKVITRVRLLPRLDVPLLEESVCFRPPVAEDEGGMSEGNAVTRVPLLVKDADDCVAESVKAEGVGPGRLVEDEGKVDTDHGTTTADVDVYSVTGSTELEVEG
jgi:hypothetical protein